jgi:enamine deaminase RidA (YjgF/YER057c/UK114 family)
MMSIRRWNPEGIAAPASRYSHAALVEGAARWLHLSGQVGVAPDGTVPSDLAGQLDQCFANVAAGLDGAGMTRADLVKLTVYVTDPSPEAVATYRARRDAFVGDGPAPAATYLVVRGLASPALLAEVDAVAATT